MDFLFVYERPNGAVKAVLFYVVHLAAMLLIGLLLSGVFGGAASAAAAARLLVLVYSMGLCAFVIHQRNLSPVTYASLAIVFVAAIFTGGIGGLIVPAFLTTRGV